MKGWFTKSGAPSKRGTNSPSLSAQRALTPGSARRRPARSSGRCRGGGGRAHCPLPRATARASSWSCSTPTLDSEGRPDLSRLRHTPQQLQEGIGEPDGEGEASDDAQHAPAPATFRHAVPEAEAGSGGKLAPLGLVLLWRPRNWRIPRGAEACPWRPRPRVVPRSVVVVSIPSPSVHGATAYRREVVYLKLVQGSRRRTPPSGDDLQYEQVVEVRDAQSLHQPHSHLRRGAARADGTEST